MKSNGYMDANNPQTEKQQLSKSPLYGYRKPHQEGTNGPFWCSCTTPTLTTGYMGRGIAHCRRCDNPYYH